MYPRTYAQYTLLERLATGGMSEVDLARRAVDDTGFVRFLVVKRIRANHVEDDAFVRMFKDEARITSELRHTHIAQVYDFGRVGDEYYLALEYVPGTDIRHVLGRLRSQRKRMPVRMALRIASDVLDALHYAHTRTDAMGRPMEVVHRDVNPRNIMISASGEVKLIDFGVARATDRLERTQTDHFKGKVAYMAPEQVHGRDLDHRVDVFAMGLTLYELLTGRGAFAGLDQTQILYRILQGQIPQLEVPKEWGAPGRSLTGLVGRALEVDPDRRYPTAAAMREAVRRVADEFGGLPTVSEVRAWLQEIDPELEGRIRGKLGRWSGPLAAGSAELDETVAGPDDLPPVPDATREPTASGQTAPGQTAPGQTAGGAAATSEVSASTLAPSPEDRTGSGTFTAPVVVAAGLGTAGVIAVVAVAVLGIGAIVVVAAIVVATSGPGQPAAAALVDTDTDAPSIEASTDTDPVQPLEVWPPPYDPDVDGPKPTTSGVPGGGSAAGTEAASAATDEAPDLDTDAMDAGSDTDEAVASGTEEGAEDGASTTPADVAQPPPPRALGQLQVTANRKGLVIYIDGEATEHRTGDEFDWPEGEYTVSAPGFSPRTVTVKPGLLGFVALKPESP